MCHKFVHFDCKLQTCVQEKKRLVEGALETLLVHCKEGCFIGILCML